MLALPLQSQTETTQTQRVFKLWTINPSYNGGDPCIRADLSYRTQWEGMDGAPKLIGFATKLPVGFYNLGGGIRFNHETIGFRNNSRIDLTADVDIQLTRNSFLSVGLNLGMDMQRYDPDILSEAGGTPVYLDEFNRNNFIGGFGATYRTGDWKMGGGGYFIPRSDSELSTLVAFYAHISYEATVNELFRLAPAILVDYTNEFGTIADLGIMGYYKNYGGLGLIYRPNRMIAFNAQVNILPYLALTYSYDINTGKYSHLGKGAHEVSLNFKMERFWK